MELNMINLRRAMEAEGYITDGNLVLSVFIALKLEKPLLVTGAPGVGKTELAKVLASVFNTDLIRLQCYEGLDEQKALYEWNYQKQLLQIQISKNDAGECILNQNLFSKDFLLERPLLKAITGPSKKVLLIDEIDKTDEEFEAFLFELLSDFQVSIPELGTIKAHHKPIVILTSNAERELSDGLKRRCVFLHIDFPSIEKEYSIIKAKIPGIKDKLAVQVASTVFAIRKQFDAKKLPSISETLDWANTLQLLNSEEITEDTMDKTLNILFKDKEDIDNFKEKVGSQKVLHTSKQQG
ncbi:MAG: MoxR family ATPase [Clostridia bacterium]|nr:MoxR family ATPase [Clostridia bacterium]